MRWITEINDHNKKQPKRDLLTMTEADRQALIKQIKECLQQRAAEAKLARLEPVEEDAPSDTDVRRPTTRFHSWYFGY